MKFLIVDDDPIARKMLRKILAPMGHCDIATEGSEAVEAFCQAHEEKTPYDIVCLDIKMPVMDGHATLKKIRECELGREIQGLDCVKILMITVLEDSKSVLSSFNEGCEGYIVKPFDKEKVVKKIKEVF